MRIRRLDLARYGRFTGATLDFGDRAEGGPDLHIVYGPNESGKTTAFNALLDLLFGIPDRHPYPYAFLHGWTALKVGAVVEGEDGRHHRLERVGRRGESLFTGDGAPADPMLLQGLLHGLGRHEFEMMFSLDESRLRDGGEAILKSEGDLGRMLFSAAAGLSDFATRFDALSADAAAFHAPRKRSGGLADLKAKLAEVDAALAKADVKVSDYRKLRDAFDAADRAFEEARQARDAARREERRLTAMAEAEQVMRDLQEAEERLAPLADLPLLPPGAETDVADLRTNRAAAAMALRLAEEEGERLRATRADLVLDPEILGAETEIAALEAAVAVAAKVEQDLPRRHEERQEAHEALLALEAALPPGLDWEPALGDTAPIDRLDQLLAQQGALIEAARSAEQELKKAEAEWTAIGTRLQRLGIAPDAASVDLDPQALGAMLRRLRDRDPVRALNEARTAADKANQALHQAIGRLAPWRGDAEELRDQEMPTADQATSWREAWRMLEDERRQNEQVLRAAGADAAEATALIDAMTAAEGLVSDDALQEARAARDTAWERHLAALDETTAAAFADRLAAHDALVERRLATGEATARLAEAQRSAAQASARRASAEKASTLVRGRQAALVAEIGPPLRLVGLIDDTDPRSDHPSEVVAAALDALPAWLARREDALARLTESVEADHAAAVAEQAAEAARAELATALDDTVDTTLDATVDAAAETPLPRLLERLESAVEAAKARSAAAAEALRARDEAAKSREDRRHRAEAAEAALETWRQDWAMAVGQLPQALATLPPDALRPHLPALRALPERRRSLDELDRRIARMAEDLTASTTAATALSTQFALADAPDAPPREVVHRLRTRLNAAQSAAEKSARLLAEAEAAATKLQTARIELEEINARLAEIAALFPSPEALKTPEALATAVSQAAERARLATRRQELETRLCRVLGVADRAAAASAMAEDDPTTLATRQDAAAATLSEAEHKLDARRDARRDAESALTALGGDDRAARLATERRTLLLEISREAETAFARHLGVMLAERALAAYRQRHRSAMLTESASAFRAMTLGSFADLDTQPGAKGEKLVALRGSTDGESGSISVEQMSTGTRAALYLALRVAGYRRFCAARGPLPFVSDDILETLDDARATAAIEAMAAMAEEGQAIHFTHHRHVCMLAQERLGPAARIHTMPA